MKFNNRQLVGAIVVSLASLSLGLASAAENRAATPASPTTDPSVRDGNAAQRAQHFMRASKLIGSKVRNQQGEELGKIEDLIVDTQNRRAHYAILSFGGIAGIGDKLFAYPVEMLSRAPDSDELLLNIERARLERAPGFEKNAWPDWGVNSYRRGVDRYFGIDRGSESDVPKLRLIRASQLIGMRVEGKDGENVGEIEDVVVNTDDGRVPFIVIDFDKAWSPDDKLLPVSLQALSFPPEDFDKAVLNETRERIEMQHGFAEKDWPDFNDPSYQREREALFRDRWAPDGKPANERPAGGASPRGGETTAPTR